MIQKKLNVRGVIANYCYICSCIKDVQETRVAVFFKNRGYSIVDFNDEADIYIINTCTVTNNSDRKDRKIINSIKNESFLKINFKKLLLSIFSFYLLKTLLQFQLNLLLLQQKHITKSFALVKLYLLL